MGKIIEIPDGKRKPLYRFFEILPGVLSYGMIILLFVLSAINPVFGAIYLLLLIAITLVKAIGTAFRTVQGQKTIERAMRVDWHQRLTDLEDPHKSYERLKYIKSDGYHSNKYEVLVL